MWSRDELQELKALAGRNTPTGVLSIKLQRPPAAIRHNWSGQILLGVPYARTDGETFEERLVRTDRRIGAFMRDARDGDFGKLRQRPSIQ